MFDIGTEIRLAGLNSKFRIDGIKQKLQSKRNKIKERRDRQFGIVRDGLKYTAEEYVNNGKINPFKAAARVFVDYCDEKDNR